MNKVVSIEIAGQVFWIDEEAYDVLQAYLKKIRLQLVDDECGSDIFKDIELRIAELLYALSSDEKKAIVAEQLNEVIEQVGFIDSEDIDAEFPRKSYLDPQNKILGGVCAGLAIRLGVSAFILRLVFIGLTALFGLGIALYLIFWISLDTNSNRNAALAAQGKARTAKQIAAFEAPKENSLVQLQRIIFLPVSIVGTLLTVIGNHFRNRSKGYLFVFKNIFVFALLFVTFFLCLGLYEFNQSRLFFWPISWGLSAATIYLIVLGLTIYVREYYLTRSNFKVKKILKVGAFIPIAIIVSVVVFLNNTQSEYQKKLVEKNFTLSQRQLQLKFNEQNPLDKYAEQVLYHVKTNTSENNQIILHIDYSSYGYTTVKAKENIHTMDYFFTFDNNTLELDKYWSLKEGALNRGQYINVTIEIPQNIIVTSSWPLTINRDDRPYHYSVREQYTRGGVDFSSGRYLSNDQYFHEYDEDFRNKLSDNERNVLMDKFCEEFFISESWGCWSNIQRLVSENSRFDRAFEQDIEIIEQVRKYLLPDRSLFVSNLIEMNDLVKGVSIEYPVMSEFQKHIEHLLSIKSTSEKNIKPGSG